MQEVMNWLETWRRSPRRFNAREFFSLIVRDRTAHLAALNQYRFSEQRACLELTAWMEQLDGCPAQLIQDLSHHIADEARHATWLTGLLIDLDANIGNPVGLIYLKEFDHLLDVQIKHPKCREDFVIALLVVLNMSEKRTCENFSAHIHALKQLPQTEENIKIRETLERILVEEAGHVSWGIQWLAQIADRSPRHRRRVETAKRRYALIEQCAYKAVLDMTLAAELRRVRDLFAIATTLPALQRISYVLQRLPRTLFAPDLQISRFYYLKQMVPQELHSLHQLFPALLRRTL